MSRMPGFTRASRVQQDAAVEAVADGVWALSISVQVVLTTAIIILEPLLEPLTTVLFFSTAIDPSNDFPEMPTWL